ncbi:MAG TPA: glycine--tRNA ligase subunit beta [Acidobacteriota bacterium]|jgi:glycyl-tRNA synthetase beta chain
MNVAFQNVAQERPETMALSERTAARRSNELVLEIGTEEVPASMMPAALVALKDNCGHAMQEALLQHSPLETFCSPRRLILHAPVVAERQPDTVEQITGPSRRVAFDENGNPTRALYGFLQKNEIGLEQVQITATPRGEYVTFRKKIQGRPALDVLSELLPGLILSVPFPKSMYWRTPQERFIRPIHYVVALLGDQVIPFEVAGIQSGRSTVGHLILAPEVFSVKSFAELKEKLADHFVIIDSDERRRLILEGFRTALPSTFRVLHDVSLLDEVVHLVEYPQVVMGDFERRFLDLPEEILITVLKKHQKYFAVIDDLGNIQPHFVTVLNTASASTKIREGHQRVLRARLEDAAFYREFDQRKKLEERIELLDHVLFQKNLGSYGDKIRRLEELAQHLAAATSIKDAADLRTAARLCKSDLTTEMVKEFTELQGIVGGLYARDEGFPETVWRAIYQHYLPVSPEDLIPDSPVAQLLSVADRVDMLCGSFGVGIVPTGSSDPFSLRRQCQGMVRIATEGGHSFSLREIFTKALELLKDRVVREHEEVIGDLFEFLDARVRHLFAEKGLQYDVINAAVEAGYDDLCDLYRRAEAVQRIRQEPDFEAIATSFKRINNILSGDSGDGQIDAALLQEPAEQELYSAVNSMEPDIQTNISQRNYYDALKIMARMRPRLDQFFDQVLVMAEDPKIRDNRLRLLKRISLLFQQVGDLSQIVVE